MLGGYVNPTNIKNLRSGPDAVGDPASYGNRSSPAGHRQPQKRLEIVDERVAPIFHVEFEPL
jgi:hypothetical protein